MRQRAQEPLPARADEHAEPLVVRRGAQLVEVREQREVVRRVLPEADAGVDVDLGHAQLARGTGSGEDVVAHDVADARVRSGASPRAAGMPRWCMATQPTPSSAARPARAPETSLRRVAPSATAARATAGLTVSTETRAAAGEGRRRPARPGRARRPLGPRRRPGRVDSPPTSRIAAPCVGECPAAGDRVARPRPSRGRRTSPASR